MVIKKFLIFSFLILILMMQNAGSTSNQDIMKIAEERIQLSPSTVQVAIYRNFIEMMREVKAFLSLGDLSLQISGDGDGIVLSVYWRGFLTPYGVSLADGVYDDVTLTRPLTVLFPGRLVSSDRVIASSGLRKVDGVARVYAQLSETGELLGLAGQDHRGFRVDPSIGSWVPAYLLTSDDFRLVFSAADGKPLGGFRGPRDGPYCASALSASAVALFLILRKERILWGGGCPE